MQRCSRVPAHGPGCARCCAWARKHSRHSRHGSWPRSCATRSLQQSRSLRCVTIADSAINFERTVEHAPGDIAEGFGRYYPREFARYLGIARSELMEAQNHLDAAARRGAMAPGVFERCWTLSRRALGATTHLMQSVLVATRHVERRGQAGREVASNRRTPTPRADLVARPHFVRAPSLVRAPRHLAPHRAPCTEHLAPVPSVVSRAPWHRCSSSYCTASFLLSSHSFRVSATFFAAILRYDNRTLVPSERAPRFGVVAKL